MIVVGVSLVAGAASAQTTSPAPKDSTPDAKPIAPGDNLSKKLNESNGVIHPKEVDPGIQKPRAQDRDTNVVPPPGTTGDRPAPQPK